MTQQITLELDPIDAIRLELAAKARNKTANEYAQELIEQAINQMVESILDPQERHYDS